MNKRANLYIRLVVLLFAVVHATYAPIPWSQLDCGGQTLPDGYNLADITTPIIPPSLNDDLETACASSSSGSFTDPTACSNKMYDVDDKIKLVYWTSDSDLQLIYKTLFGQCPSTPVMGDQLRADIDTLDILNKTLFGNLSVTPNEPGLMRDLLSMLDGIAQIQVVANGQVNSIKQASSSQKTASNQVQASLLTTAQQIAAQTLTYMNYLVANRTLVQTQSYADIKSSVGDSIVDIGQQADDIVAGFTSDYSDLSDRYNVWKAASDQAIADTTTRSAALKAALQGTVTAGQAAATQFNADQSALMAQALSDSQSDFTTALISAQSDIQDSLTSAVTDMANDISGDRADFLNDAGALQKDIQNQLAILAGNVVGDASLNPSNDQQSRLKADASVASLQTVIQTSILPLISDVLASMNQVTALQNSIAATRAQIDADVNSVRGPATQAAIDLGTKISDGFASARGSFNSAFDQARGNMQDAITAKVADGRSKLATILGGAQDSQQGTTAQQQAQGAATQAQSDASQTAADLTAAKGTLASDKAKASLDTMVNFVASALGDSQDTLSESTKKILSDVQNAQGSATAQQRRALERAYDRLQKEKSDAADRTNGLRAASFQAQSDGQDMMSAVGQGATQLDGSVSYQSKQAQTLLGQTQDLLAGATTNGGGLQDQMSAFEQQAPSLVAILQQKIGAYKTLVTAQAVQAQAGSANAVRSGAGDAFDGLTTYFQNANMQPGDPSYAATQASTATDSNSLVNDVQALNLNLQQQAQAGSNVVQSSAQAAMTKTMAQLQSVSGDSSSAISALLAYDSDMIARKKATILASGGNAIDAASSAADYLTSSANAFLARSQSFINDAANVGGLAQMNLSKLVNDVNSTLVQVGGASDNYVARLTQFGSTLQGWKSDMTTRAAAVNLAIQQKVANVTAILTAIDGGSSSDLQNSAQQLQSYIDSLVANFQQQRDAFNSFAEKYVLRRLSVITGLSQAVLAQKAAFLSSVGGADLSESQRTAQATSTLQGLLAAVQKAKSDGDVNMNQVTSMIGGIGDGMSSLTTSLTNQMNTQVGQLQQQSIMSAMDSGTSLGGSVDQTSQTASLLGNQFANALETVSTSSTAAQMAAASSNKDIYSIAGLLQSVSQATRLKVVALMNSVASGKISIDQALDAARNLNDAQISTVEDIINSLASYVGTHVAEVNDFENGLNISKAVAMSTVNSTIASHADVEADTIADLAEASGQIASLKSTLLGDNGTLVTLENARKAKIDDLETYIQSVLYGSDDGSYDSLFPTSQTTNISLNSTGGELLSLVNSQTTNISLNSTGGELLSSVNSTGGSIPSVAGLIQIHASPIIGNLLQLRKRSVESLSEFMEVQRRDANISMSIPDALLAAQSALATAKTNESVAAANFSNQADTAMKNAQSAIQEILTITANALQM